MVPTCATGAALAPQRLLGVRCSDGLQDVRILWVMWVAGWVFMVFMVFMVDVMADWCIAVLMYLWQRWRVRHSKSWPLSCSNASLSCVMQSFYLLRLLFIFFYCVIIDHLVNTENNNISVHASLCQTAGVPVYPCMDCSCVYKKLGSLNAHISKMHISIMEVESSSNSQVHPTHVHHRTQAPLHRAH